MFTRKRPSRVSAPELTLLESGSGSKTLALGMQWQPIVTAAGYAKTARASVLKSRGTHMVLTPSIYGYGRFSAKGPKRTDSIVSAAMLASQHTRDGLFGLKLPNGKIWFCATQNGKPTGTEQIFDFEHEAIDRLQSLQAGNEAMSIYTDLQTVNASFFTFADLILMPPANSAKVQFVSADSFISKLPLPAKMALVLFVIGSVGYQLYEQQIDDEKAARVRQLRAMLEEEGASLWKAQISKEMGRRAVNLDIKKFSDSFLPLPTLLQGWALQNAQCSSSFASGNKTWTCEAAYEAPKPLTGKTYAANASIVVPSGFDIEYLPTNALKLRWTTVHSAKTLTHEDLQPKDVHLVHTASIIQKKMNTLESVSDIKFSEMKFDALKRSDGLSLPRPSSIAPVLEATVVVRALLPAYKDLWGQLPVDWQTAKLSLVPGALRPDVILEMTGVIYAK